MKVVSRYCDSCGVKIPAQDIQDEVALKYEDSYYCRDCKAEVVPLLDKKSKEAAGGAAAGKTPAKSAAGAATKAGAAPARRPPAPPDSDEDEAEESVSESEDAEDLAPPPKKIPGAKPVAAKPGGKPAGKPGAAAGAGALRRPLGKPAPLAKKPSRPAPDEEEGGSGEELSAEDAPKKKPLVPIAIGGAVVLAVGLYFAFSGGGNKVEGEKSAQQEVKKNPHQLQREKDEKLVAKALAEAKGKPKPEQIRILKGLALSNQISLQEVMDKLDADIERIEEEYNDEGKATFEKLNGEAQKLGEVGDFDEAIAALKAFPEELRETAWYTRNLQAEIAKLERKKAAKSEGEPIVRKAEEYARQKEFRLAIGVLEGFDQDEYRGTPWVERIDVLKRRYDEAATAVEQEEDLSAIELQKKKEEEARLAELARQRAEEDKRIAGMKWQSLPTDDLFTWKAPTPMPKGAWKADSKTKELTGTAGAALEGQDIAAAAGVGDKTWTDCIYRFRYKVVKGGFRIGVRATEGGACVAVQPDLLKDGQWHSIEVSCRGMEDDAIEQIVDGMKKTLNPKDVPNNSITDSAQGGILFALLPNSECVFAELQVKVVKKG